MVSAEETETAKSTFSIDGVEVQNMTDLVIKDGKIETVKDGDKEVSNVTLTNENGDAMVFEKVDVQDWKDLKFVEDYEMYYIQYTDKEGKAREAEENADEIIWSAPVTMYASGSVNVRTEPKNEASAVYYASLGEELTAIGIAPGWFKVKLQDGTEAYIYHKYLTEDKAYVDGLVEAAAAAAAAAQQYSYDDSYDYDDDYSYSAPSGGGAPSQEECMADGLLY